MDAHRERVYRRIVESALEEDLGLRGDITSQLVLTGREGPGRAVILSREPGVLAGRRLAELTFQTVDPALEVDFRFEDGQAFPENAEIAQIQGNPASILMAERVALNFLGRLSGIATLTRRFVEALEGTGAVLLDTRKTTPGLRLPEKDAVRAGGGSNHRFGLFDGILIKDNHIRWAGGVGEALKRARPQAPHGLKIEIEVSNLKELQEALDYGADIVLLDNFDLEDIEEAMQRIPPGVRVEVSGGVTLENVRQIALLGVHYISVGALTHSARWINFSLEVAE